MKNPTVDDVHAAVRWALTHDLPALLEYREVTHLNKNARWKADAAFVAHWQQVTSTGLPTLTGVPARSAVGTLTR